VEGAAAEKFPNYASGTWGPKEADEYGARRPALENFGEMILAGDIGEPTLDWHTFSPRTAISAWYQRGFLQPRVIANWVRSSPSFCKTPPPGLMWLASELRVQCATACRNIQSSLGVIEQVPVSETDSTAGTLLINDLES